MKPAFATLIQPTRFLMMAFLLGGTLGHPLVANAASSSPKSSAHLATHKLQPMDLIKLQFFQEADLDRELRVSQDNKIVLPLVGAVDVKGRTVRDTEILITELYRKDYLVNPQVNITVLEYAQRTITVLGAVNSPGAVVIPPERTMTFLDAIARSGGFSRLANRKSVSLTRNLPDGQTANFTINADEMMIGDAANQWTVKDGDIISVPERLL
jgi:polysaccharide biosynthesis/export protein